MTGKTQAARQPTIDELLASIRQAIQDRVGPAGRAAGAPSLAVVQTSTGSTVGSGAEEENSRTPRHVQAPGREGFAGLLGGDVRLEEALARLNRPEWRRGAEPVTQPIPATAKPSSPRHGEPAADGARPGYKRTALDQQRERSTPPPAAVPPGGLLSPEASRAAGSAFNRLAHVLGSRSAGGEATLDGITQDCLKPLLKDWLDENLPGLVERLVREEIARLARTSR